MKDQIIQKINKMMSDCNIWSCAQNLKIYTTDEFIELYGHKMSDELKQLLTENVGRIQKYLDDNILEPR